MKNCPTCGSENYDTLCAANIVNDRKINNCIPKDYYTKDQANTICRASKHNCKLIHNKDVMLNYQKEECKRPDGDYDYYCAYNQSDICSYNLCEIDNYYAYGEQSKCKCQKVPGENLPENLGRECKFKNCSDYKPKRILSEIFNDPGLVRFFSGYNTLMDLPS